MTGDAVTARTLAVVSAGLSTPSATRLLADRLYRGTQRALATASITATPVLVELRSHARDITNALLTRVPSPALSSALAAVAGSDGLIAVTPVFNGSYSGLFKMFFDVLDPDSMAALAGKPVLAGATGNSPRHSLVIEHAIRPMFGYLRSVVVPTGVYAAGEDWGAADGSGGGGVEALDARIARAAGELADLIAARPPASPAAAARPASAVPPADPFADFTPFEQLLNG
jgi:FMN reductase